MNFLKKLLGRSDAPAAQLGTDPFRKGMLIMAEMTKLQHAVKGLQSLGRECEQHGLQQDLRKVKMQSGVFAMHCLKVQSCGEHEVIEAFSELKATFDAMSEAHASLFRKASVFNIDCSCLFSVYLPANKIMRLYGFDVPQPRQG